MRTMAAMVGLIGTLLLGDAAQAESLRGGGTWQSTNAGGVSGEWSVDLTRTDRTVRGTLTLKGSNVFSGGEVEGVVTDDQVVLGVFQQGTRLASFAGKLDGGAVAGEWDCPSLADEGAWEGRLGAVKK